MYGTGTEFCYSECAQCGRLALDEDIEDMSKFYPSESYCSFVQTTGRSRSTAAFEALALAQLGLRGQLVERLSRLAPKPPVVNWLKGVPTDARVLDVGCGNGRVLAKMSRLGFTSLTGIDPFLPEAEIVIGGAVLRRVDLLSVHDEFDFIMFQHTLEHMPRHHATLEHAAKLLSPNGRILVRIPLAGSTAWDRYGVDWAQLDAPRHVMLHTPASMRRLAEQVGLVVRSVRFDSTSFQFSASELYKRGRPLVNGLGVRQLRDEFGVGQLLRWEVEARRANRNARGDQAAFVLEHRDGRSRALAGA